MKKINKKKLLIIKRSIAKLNNPYSVFGGNNTGGETTDPPEDGEEDGGKKKKKKLQCINTSNDWVPVIDED